MGIFEGLNRGGSFKDTIIGGFKNKFDGGLNNFGEDMQESSLRSSVGGSVSGQMRTNNFLSKEMNELNFNVALNQVVKKAGENAKTLTQ
ncbi:MULTISPECIES: serine kinase [Xanthomonas]|uniref:Serine kinase n=1 Tax=Xanthomonas cucurbitae TaxID=56453 RepID=A0A2S7DF42_9XANT|nr:serine kinase [Xanthomonas cucurbitae]PPU72443.1 hypothetical protein XcuCFBP2542_17160 [Xanthomonas cucurbitae]QHG88386.1 serine kinase [Xanthomonas cucurbitae]WDM69907.1 serine kinase [Xanthomonas cucurbitae]WDM73780.1 serine kinase [Xanthomonas cucurbitae]WDM77483.1 serine kinase [Xanthomonas cucurbitae]